MNSQSFVFYTERRLVTLTGIRAKNLPELLAGIRDVPGSSIFYHTHHQYLAHHFEKPFFYSDFAQWCSEALQEARLAEELAAIDLLAFTSVRELRTAIAEAVERQIGRGTGPPRECLPGNEFHFNKSQSFIMPTRIVAHTIPEFFELLPRVTTASLYFHFFEARLRLGKTSNDFSEWFSGQGENELAETVARIDPYVRTLDELRTDLIALGKDYTEARQRI